MICAICVQAEYRNPVEKAIKITNYDRYSIQLSRTYGKNSFSNQNEYRFCRKHLHSFYRTTSPRRGLVIPTLKDQRIPRSCVPDFHSHSSRRFQVKTGRDEKREDSGREKRRTQLTDHRFHCIAMSSPSPDRARRSYSFGWFFPRASRHFHEHPRSHHAISDTVRSRVSPRD